MYSGACCEGTAGAAGAGLFDGATTATGPVMFFQPPDDAASTAMDMPIKVVRYTTPTRSPMPAAFHFDAGCARPSLCHWSISGFCQPRAMASITNTKASATGVDG